MIEIGRVLFSWFMKIIYLLILGKYKNSGEVFLLPTETIKSKQFHYFYALWCFSKTILVVCN